MKPKIKALKELSWKVDPESIRVEGSFKIASKTSKEAVRKVF